MTPKEIREWKELKEFRKRKKEERSNRTKEQIVDDILKTQYYADFETTPEANRNKDGSVRVYMWQIVDSKNGSWRGTSIGSFVDQVAQLSKGKTISLWFHNLKFDFSYFEPFILKTNRAKFKKKKKMLRWNTFGKEYTVMRDGRGAVFSADWFVNKDSFVKFYDSAKLYPMPLEQLGEQAGISKLTELYDYDKYIPDGYNPTDDEWEYIFSDVKIVRYIIEKQIHKAGIVRMTRSSYAYNDLRDTYINENTPEDWEQTKRKLKHKDGSRFKKRESIFEYHFPVTSPELYLELKAAYSGGYTQLMPNFAEKMLDDMVSYDVNSEYPGVMLDKNNLFPIGHEETFNGDYHQLDENTRSERPLFVQKFVAKFKLKENGLPCLPKKFSDFNRAIYKSSDLKGRRILTLADIDMKHFLKNYDVEKISFIGGWHWRGTPAPFASYIEKVSKEKITAELLGDKIGRTIAKLEMNGCYGKFAENPFKFSKESYLDEEGILRFNDEAEEPEGSKYFPMGIFITAYARNTLFNGIYKAGMDRFVYCDTDSIHLLGTEPVEGLDIHPTRLGAWKWEEEGENGAEPNRIERAIYLREKTYAHEHTFPVEFDKKTKEPIIDDVTKEPRRIDIKAAGLSQKSKDSVHYMEDFKLGETYEGSLTSEQSVGGICLINRAKTLKETRMTPSELEYLSAI